MKGIIYKATSNYDGRVYIGQTIASLRHRRAEHEKDSKSENDWNYFHTALYQQNYDFEWEVIDTYEGDADFVHHALNVAEEYHIIKYRSAEEKYGYNSTYGGYSSDKYAKHYKVRRMGVGAPMSFWQYDLDGNFIREWRSLREIADAFNRPKIGARKLSGQWRGYQWRPKMSDHHPVNIGKYERMTKPTVRVAMYGTDGKFIKIFDKRIDAEKEYGCGITVRDDFSKAVTLSYNKRDSFLFYRVQDGEYPESVNVTVRPAPRERKKGNAVVLHKYDAYDLSGNFIARYNSQMEAGNATGMCGSAIREGCQRGEPIRITSETKMLWRYGDGEIREKIDVIPFIPKGKPEPKMEHRVLQYSLDGEYIATHKNALKASKESGDSYATINKMCDGKSLMHSPHYQWRRYTEGFALQIKGFVPYEKKTENGRVIAKTPKVDHRILQYSIGGRYIATYKTIREAAAVTGEKYHNIVKISAGGVLINMPLFQWRHYTDNFPRNIGPIKIKGHKRTYKVGRPRKSIHSPGQQTLF